MSLLDEMLPDSDAELDVVALCTPDREDELVACVVVNVVVDLDSLLDELRLDNEVELLVVVAWAIVVKTAVVNVFGPDVFVGIDPCVDELTDELGVDETTLDMVVAVDPLLDERSAVKEVGAVVVVVGALLADDEVMDGVIVDVVVEASL